MTLNQERLLFSDEVMAEEHPPSPIHRNKSLCFWEIADRVRNDYERRRFVFLGFIVTKKKNINYLNNIALGMMPAVNEPSSKPSLE